MITTLWSRFVCAAFFTLAFNVLWQHQGKWWASIVAGGLATIAVINLFEEKKP